MMDMEFLKAPVGGIQKFSTEDGPGIRTTVFFKGCPLNCKWCHNPELIDFSQQLMKMSNSCIKCGYCVGVCPEHALYFSEEGRVQIDRQLCSMCMKCVEGCYARALQPVAEYMTVEEIINEVVQDKGFYDNTGGGITLSGGEILSHGKFVEILIDKAKEEDMGICLDTSGYGDGSLLKKLASKANVTDILFDMKSIEPNIHREYTGKDNGIILENLKLLAADDNIREKVTMRMPLIKDVNDDLEIIEKTAKFYMSCRLKKVTLLPYHNLGMNKEKNIGGIQEEFLPPDDERVAYIKKYFEEYAGMETEILGKL